MNRRLLPLILTAAVALGVALSALTAGAAPTTQQTLPPGTVITLSGTPHLWIADEQGVLHWGGDTRALVGRSINWSDRRDVTIDTLRAYRRGDPYLSAGLLKIGDPIYLVKWETNQERPTLLHIQSIADVEIFGIDATNYGRFVMDQATWEQRFGMSVSSLTRGELQPAIPSTATPTPAVTATPVVTLKIAEIAYDHDPNNTGGEINVGLEVSGARPGQRLTVQAVLEECTNSDCTTTRSDKWGPLDAGVVNTEGKLRWFDRHSYYKSYTYTFTDPQGSTVSKAYGNDMVRTGKISG
jgi:hypothetical protein